MIIPVSPSAHKNTKDIYIKEPDLSDNIIWSCEHINRCSNPLYVGRCREDCFNRYRGGD